MASIVISATEPDGGFSEVLDKAAVPEDLKKYLTDTCGVDTLQLLLGYVVRAQYETELAAIVKDQFKVKEGFTAEQQRLYVSKLRGAYRTAMDVEEAMKGQAAKRLQENSELDLEKPLDPGTAQELKAAWFRKHDWQPTKYMRSGPAFRNRVYREIHSKSLTMHPVEKAMTVEDSKRPKELARVPLGPQGHTPVILETFSPLRRHGGRILRSSAPHHGHLRVLRYT